ncbi:probable protein S-acyltransferase 15 [Rutidosis leptorrhynchoides]|uniref:probable protein S-acyltransferase 15 n=1 Tax=Rutidosis leptorrhynchoides TaxID=125765 RepID=UPI003A995DE3
MKCQRFVSLPILAVFVLMEMVYYGTVFIFLDDWIGLQSSIGWTNAVIFTLFASFTLFSFLVCVLTDPGGVPSGYFPDIETNDGSDQESRKAEALKKRCDKCSAYKPPRAHHCRVCRRCVLKMDHHCTWINNCVGQRNYKAYFLLVLYATISSLHSTAIIVGCGVYKDWESAGMTRLKTFYITSGVMISLLSLTLGTLLGWHIYLLTHNMTTIEYYEGTRAAWLANKSGQIYRHPYDVGVYRNLTVVLGPNILKWFWPSALSHVKDGTSFPTVRDSL